MKKYILLKAYFNQNLGDDLFVHIIAKRYPNYKFLLYSSYKQGLPDNCYLGKDIEYVFFDKIHSFLCRRGISNKLINYIYSQKLKKIVDNAICCVYIIGSGFMESDSGLPNQEFQNIFYSAKTYIIGCNFGPFKSLGYYKRYYKIFEDVADVCFRERYSKKLFKPLQLRNEADVVFSYDFGEELPVGFPKGNYIVLSLIDLRNYCKSEDTVNEYKRFLVNCIIYWAARGKKIVMAVFCKNEGDLIAALDIKEIVDCLNNKINIEICIYPEYSIEEMMGLFKNSDLVIATRYHAMIIGLLYQKKVYPIAYSNKTIHVIEDIFGKPPIAQAYNVRNISPEDFFENYGLKLSFKQYKNCVESANRQFEKLDKFLMNYTVI